MFCVVFGTTTHGGGPGVSGGVVLGPAALT